MVDFLAIWGVTQAVGFVLKPILEDLAKDTAKDWAKDMLKGCLNKVIQLPEASKESLIQQVSGKALKEFFQLVQDELEEKNLEEKEIKEYIEPFKKLIKIKAVKECLGEAFNLSCESLNLQRIVTVYQELQLKSLPNNFNWERVGKKYLKKVKSIYQESPELQRLFELEMQSQTADNTREALGIVPEFDLIKYQETLKEKYGFLKLESLDTDGASYNRLKLWGMFIPQNVKESQEYLPKVYELPKDLQKQLQKEGSMDESITTEKIEELERRYVNQSVKPVLEVIKDKQCKYLVILGDPGSGKTTLLYYLALQWAKLSPSEIPLHPLPILIELRTYARKREERECSSFLEFLHGNSSAVYNLNQIELENRLKRGHVLMMFDGLDEVFDPARRNDIINEIHNYTNTYPDNQFIVTSRVIGYKPQALQNAEFQHFMLQDLDENQIGEFINKWHDLTYSELEERERKKERLKQGITNSKAIQELAGNPLLLTMMAILNRHQELPRDRAELYNQCSRVLLHQWDIERQLQDKDLDAVILDYRDKQAILRDVAYFMQSTREGLAGNIISRENLETILTESLQKLEVKESRNRARKMIEQLRCRNFILCFLGNDYYAFVHRTFLEYFCAVAFVEQFEKKQTLSLEKLKTDIFGQHWQDEKWHEVLRLISGLIDADFVEEIICYLMGLQDQGVFKVGVKLYLLSRFS